jgi:CheY-like chemotaxis protein/anti-sigma regulatory factor (Ser/Thr protein kinase)
MQPTSSVDRDNGQLKILVADDTQANLLLISKFIARLGHIVVTAANGMEAVEAFAREAPDMVLMDVMMPVMDGLEATAKIKALSRHWVPVIIVSAKSHELDQAKGLEIGADDYLTKPINFVILEAKINVMRRIALMQRQLADNTRQLERYRDEAEEEQRIADELMKRLIHAEGLSDKMLQYWVSPARRFSGDLVAATRSRSNDLYVILADATGHGLPAALNLLPITQIFYGMAEKGFSVSHIAEEMNRKISALTPSDRFVAAVIACINPREKIIEIWNGGNPSPVFVTGEGHIAHHFASRHLPLGILNQQLFDSQTEIHPWETAGRLVICSDGLLEAENANGQAFGKPRFLQVLEQVTDRQRFISLVAALQEHLGNLAAHDDISLVMVSCPAEKETVSLPETAAGRAQTMNSGHWNFTFAISAPELRHVDIIPLLLHNLEAMELGKEHSSHLFLVISELFNNALDHGLLRLDSKLKAQPDGFDQYIALRQERLQTLVEGEIEIQLEHFTLDGKRMLRIAVKDSGPGFDYPSVLSRTLDDNTTLSGRGIPLVKSLCVDMRYDGNGNEAVVHYAL